MEGDVKMEEDATAIAEYLRERRWDDALDRVDKFIADWDDEDAEVTDTKTMDMYEAIGIISPAVQLHDNLFLPPNENDRYEDDDAKYEAAWVYIYRLRTLINVAFRNLAGPAGGRRRRRGKRGKRGKTAKQRRRTSTKTSRHRRRVRV